MLCSICFVPGCSVLHILIEVGVVEVSGVCTLLAFIGLVEELGREKQIKMKICFLFLKLFFIYIFLPIP